MSTPSEIERYLAELGRELPGKLRGKRRILREVEDHLHEAVSRLEAAGVRRPEAERRAVAAFGAPSVVAARFGPAARARPRFVVLASAAALAVAAVGGALAAALSHEPAGDAGEPTFSWRSGVPGRALDLERMPAWVAARSGVDPSTIREVVSASTGHEGERELVLAGRGLASGKTYIALAKRVGRRWGIVGEFHPLEEVTNRGVGRIEVLSGWDGTAGALGETPIIRFESGGGSRPDRVDWSTVVGIARSDVERVVVKRADGSRRDLPLNEWRGFGYSATRKGRFAAALLAYGRGGILLGETFLHPPSPVCGGGAGPCDAMLEDIIARKQQPSRAR